MRFQIACSYLVIKMVQCRFENLPPISVYGFPSTLFFCTDEFKLEHLLALCISLFFIIFKDNIPIKLCSFEQIQQEKEGTMIKSVVILHVEE
jgi:hypothetical protein